MARQKYYPFGAIRPGGTGTMPTDKAFTGQYADATGLYFFNARYYSSAVGRFISADSIVPGAADGSGGGAATLGYDKNTRLTPLTTDFHEFVAQVGEENRLIDQYGPYFKWDEKVRKEHPVPMGPVSPQALNRYSYSLSNPLKYTDPSGFYSEDQIKQFFGLKSDAPWEEVLKFFEKGGELEGRWGWLAILQKAEFGDDIKIEWDTPLLPEGHPAVKEVFAGRFEESPEGELWIVGGNLFIDQIKAAKYGREYELTHYHPMNAGKVVAGAFLMTAVDFGIGIPAAYVTAQSAGNPLVIKAVEALEVAVVLPANALGLKLIIDGLGHAPEKLTVPADFDPWAILPRLKLQRLTP